MSDEQGSKWPVPATFDSWPDYWQAHGMPWRKEPEIDEERQAYLAARRAVRPNIEKGIYPFRDENGGIKLTRADVEWLLATHESRMVRGPVEWDDPGHRTREGLDLRGACMEAVILDGLPLTRLRGALTGDEYDRATSEQRDMAAVQLRDASLRYTRLEGSALTRARLDGVNLHYAHLERADLYKAHFASIPPADLTLAIMDTGTRLDGVVFGNKQRTGPRMEGVQWNGARLSSINWSEVRTLGDEYAMRATVAWDPPAAYGDILLVYQVAVQAYRQVAVVLREQGLNEHADRFAYRAQVLQRRVLRQQRHWLRWLGSSLLDLIAGYGYRPLRSFATYLAVVVGFAAIYLALGGTGGHALTWNEALVVSLTAFHGRGFFASAFQPGDPQAAVAAAEAVLGLLIEITFIATFTQRFFAR
jgi:uncharacterized protein YjbI with pentapeptide repeats